MWLNSKRAFFSFSLVFENILINYLLIALERKESFIQMGLNPLKKYSVLQWNQVRVIILFLKHAKSNWQANIRLFFPISEHPYFRYETTPIRSNFAVKFFARSETCKYTVSFHQVASDLLFWCDGETCLYKSLNNILHCCRITLFPFVDIPLNSLKYKNLKWLGSWCSHVGRVSIR